jgi:hypothetical protein
MSPWVWVLFALGLIKLPIAALMLWLPFRHDDVMNVYASPAEPGEDGGTAATAAGPLDPHPRPPIRPRPRPPRRGPHGSPPPPSPRRVRSRVSVARRAGVHR